MTDSPSKYKKEPASPQGKRASSPRSPGSPGSPKNVYSKDTYHDQSTRPLKPHHYETRKNSRMTKLAVALTEAQAVTRLQRMFRNKKKKKNANAEAGASSPEPVAESEREVEVGSEAEVEEEAEADLEAEPDNDLDEELQSSPKKRKQKKRGQKTAHDEEAAVSEDEVEMETEAQNDQMEESQGRPPSKQQMSDEKSEEKDKVLLIAGKALSFRNYKPFDKKLRHMKKPDAEIMTIDKEIAEIASKIKRDKENQELSFDITPKAPNWDLKRDVAERLEILKGKTQKAIVELLQEKVKRQEEQQETERVSN